jgi:hypothetical protein
MKIGSQESRVESQEPELSTTALFSFWLLTFVSQLSTYHVWSGESSFE